MTTQTILYQIAALIYLGHAILAVTGASSQRGSAPRKSLNSHAAASGLYVALFLDYVALAVAAHPA